MVIPGADAEAILTRAHNVMQQMDRVKEALKSGDPQTVLRGGSGEL